MRNSDASVQTAGHQKTARKKLRGRGGCDISREGESIELLH